MTQVLQQVRSTRADTYNIPNLLSLGLGGHLRVPHFQRNFVWDADDVRKLFDSIWRGFPLGTLLLWRHEAPAQTTGFGALQLSVPSQPDALWVVDGQQRLTSLIGVLTKSPRGIDERFEVYFDLRRRRFVTSQKATVPPTWLPLHEAIDTRSLLGWLRDHALDLDGEDLDVADALGGALRDYEVPAYIVESDDEFVLREIFDRVNSAGKPIGRFDVFHALFASGSDPESPATVVTALERLGFGTLDPSRVVQTLIALRCGNVQRDLHDEFDSNGQVGEWYDLTEQALSRAITFLRAQGVPHLALLPSTLPLPVLGAFFHLHPEPDPWTLKLLARWLWRGWVHGFGRRGQTPALRQAIRAVNPVKGSPAAAPDEGGAVIVLLKTVPDEVPPVPAVTPFRTDTAAGRLVLLALAAQRPLDAVGAPLDIAGLLQGAGIGPVTELIPNRRGDVGARGFWSPDGVAFSGDLPEAVLRSQAVSSLTASLLREGRVDEFLEHRRTDVLALTQRYLAARVEAKALVRPPLSSLVVPDPDES